MTKEECRKYFKQRRQEISPGQLRLASEKIADLLFKHFNFEGKTFSIFLPIERQKEINTYIIIEKAIALGATVAIPKANFESLEIKNYTFNSSDPLVISAYGIPEPKEGKVVSNQKLNMVFIPLLAVDQRGYRVGYGKGFYDRFLRKCPSNCTFIGLHLFDLVDSISDIDEFDIPLHFCITPEKIIRFEKE